MAVARYGELVALAPEDAVAANNLAWVLATSPDASLRDGGRAVELSRRACELSEWRTPGHMNTHAAAWAETGDFGAALEWVERALAADMEISGRYTPFAEAYREGRAWREERPGS